MFTLQAGRLLPLRMDIEPPFSIVLKAGSMLSIAGAGHSSPHGDDLVE
jgi:hypothetical protein